MKFRTDIRQQACGHHQGQQMDRYQKGCDHGQQDQQRLGCCVLVLQLNKGDLNKKMKKNYKCLKK